MRAVSAANRHAASSIAKNRSPAPGSRRRVAARQYAGQVMASEGSRTGPGGTRLVNLIRAIRGGEVAQVVSGVTMWRQRIRKKCAAANVAQVSLFPIASGTRRY
jgi:hypothetical protein